jgi:hypothetical protein
MKEVYFTAWPFSKPQVLRWPVARAEVKVRGDRDESKKLEREW